MQAVTEDITIVLRLIGSEKYVFFYDRHTRCQYIRKLFEFARNPELSFSGTDVVALCQKMKEEA